LRDYIDPEMTTMEAFKRGGKFIYEETLKLREELKEDWIWEFPRVEDTKIEWKFDSDKCLKQWITTADSDWGEGYSHCTFERSPTGK